jgi:hypothetical protein
MSSYEADTPAVTSSPTKLIAIAAGSVLAVALLIGGGLYLLSGDQPAPPTLPAQQTTKSAAPASGTQSSTENRMFTIEMGEGGQAEVFKGNDRVGTTPYKFEAKPGEQIDLVLKRDGYHDLPVRVLLSENKKVYTFTMTRKQ